MTAALRDQFAVAAYPAALADALRGYGHICEPVVERAVRLAYVAADAAMAHRHTLGRLEIGGCVCGMPCGCTGPDHQIACDLWTPE